MLKLKIKAMDHNYVRNDDFNILTIRFNKGVFDVTGETRESIAIGDTINYFVGDKGDVIGVNKVLERRDSKDFPKGNGMFYRVQCSQCPRPEPVTPQK